MTSYEYTLVGAVFFLFGFIWLGARYIKHIKTKKHNTEVWGTIFEGVTNKLIDLDPVKKPEVFIEKKAKRSGQNKDDEVAVNISSKND